MNKQLSVRIVNSGVNPQPKGKSAAAGVPQEGESVPTFGFRDLSGPSPEVFITHLGQTYRLRVTRNGKLILNK